jgi:hypothetical protein
MDLLYINKGDGTFREEAAQRGIQNPFPASSVLFSDINRDGWLDLLGQKRTNPSGIGFQTCSIGDFLIGSRSFTRVRSENSVT